MPLADDLLAQAQHLSRLEDRRPKQSSLRRSTSTAYYALFHLLTEASAKNISRGNSRKLTNFLQRKFEHKTMKAACKAMISAPSSTDQGLYTNPISADLKTVADTFISLHALRETADYNLGETFTREDVLVNIEKAGNAFKAWKRAADTPNAKIFLLLLLFRQ